MNLPEKSHTMKSTFLLFCLATLLCFSFRVQAQFGQSAKIVGERESRAEFGTSVGIHDQFAVVGASRETVAAGAAYVYKLNDENQWEFSQKLVAEDAVEMAEFGGSMRLENNYLAIGSGRADINGTQRAGAIYMYDLVGTNWVFVQKLVASDYSDTGLLAVNPTSMDSENNTVVAGAPGTSNWEGGVYIFEREESEWVETQIIHSPEIVEFSNFGIGVSISGNFLIAGASGENNGAGAAYLYQKNENGIWDFMQRIEASDPQTNAYFGNAVSIDGNQLVVGAYAEGSEGGNIAAAYIFEQNDADEWVEIQKIPSPVSDENTFYGWMVQMEGNQMVITAPHVFGLEAGQVFHYQKLENGQWQEVLSIIPEDDILQDFYGWSIDLHGGNLIVGSTRDDFDENGENEMQDAGSAYIFNHPNLSVVEMDDAHFVRIYPNPVGNILHVQSDKTIQSIQILSLTGQILYTTKSKSFDVSFLSKGVYLIKVQNESGQIETKNLIKK